MQKFHDMLFGDSNIVSYQKIPNVKPTSASTHFKFNIRIRHKINSNNIVTYEINNYNIPKNLFILKFGERYDPNKTTTSIIAYLKKYTLSELEKVRLEITNEEDLRKMYKKMYHHENCVSYNSDDMLNFVKSVISFDSKLYGIQECKNIHVKSEKLITSRAFRKIMNGKILPDFPTHLTYTVW